MEKRRPHHDLARLQAVFSTPSRLVATTTAVVNAASLGLGRAEIVEILQTLKAKHFRKSMTAYIDHTRWQDVYIVPSEAGDLYVKFTDDAVTEFKLLSFKEKDR